MSNTKHTPGPWRLETVEGSYDHRHEIRILGSGIPINNKPHGGNFITQMPLTQIANAHLIAAAPELLAICEEIAGDKNVDLVNSERRRRLYSAITKAGGSL